MFRFKLPETVNVNVTAHIHYHVPNVDPEKIAAMAARIQEVTEKLRRAVQRATPST